MIKKLRLKFIVITMTIVTLMLIIILGLVLYFTSNNLKHENIRMMQSVATRPFFMPGPQAEPNGAPQAVRLPYFTLRLDKTGTLIESSGGYYDLSNRDFLDELITSSFALHKETGELKDFKLRFLHVETPKDQLLIFSDISSEITTMQNLLKSCILIGILSFICFLGISTLLAQWAIKPVATAWKRQKQFIADASHELKTPLTVILTNAEFLQDPNYDDLTKKRFINNILLMSKQMKHLVLGLLDLTKVDNGIARSTMTTLNFSELIESSSFPFEPLYFENTLFLSSQIDHDIYVKGNVQYLHQVIDILLDNALKYAKKNTEVMVTLKKHGLHCLLSVKNCGDEISFKDTKNIFERFYTTDSSRTSNHSYGLGLSIAKSIILDHGGKIWCESSKGLNTFCVQLRLCNWSAH